MTNQEFLDFDTSIFYQEGYENELKYMGNLTAYVVAAISDTRDRYDDAEKNNRPAVRPNVWRTWFKYGNTIRKFLNADKVGSVVPEHTKENEFLARYEEICKRFLLAYDAQYKEFAENKDEYYTVHLCKSKLLGDLYPKTNEEKKISIEQIVDAGFVDLRLPFCYSLDENGKIQKNEYTDGMADLHDKFDASLVATIANIEKKSPTATDTKKRIK